MNSVAKKQNLWVAISRAILCGALSCVLLWHGNWHKGYTWIGDYEYWWNSYARDSKPYLFIVGAANSSEGTHLLAVRDWSAHSELSGATLERRPWGSEFLKCSRLIPLYKIESGTQTLEVHQDEILRSVTRKTLVANFSYRSTPDSDSTLVQVMASRRNVVYGWRYTIGNNGLKLEPRQYLVITGKKAILFGAGLLAAWALIALTLWAGLEFAAIALRRLSSSS